MAAPLQYTVHPFSSYGYAYGPSTTTAVPPAADYTWGATAAQYSQWQTPSAQTSPNLLDPEPDALQSRTLFFGRLPDDITEEKLRSICEQHGDIKRISVYPEKRMAFVEFFDLRHADAARELLRGTELLGKKIEVQFSAVKRPDKDGNTGTLYVRPSSAVHAANWTDPNTLEAYKSLFSKHGDLKKISVNRKRETLWTVNSVPVSLRAQSLFYTCRSRDFPLKNWESATDTMASRVTETLLGSS
ncbi:rna recognition motif-containing protein, partial [Cystoisospora suis]